MRIDYSNQKIMVVGAGSTGVALCRYFSERGGTVTLSDRRGSEAIDGLAPLENRGVSFDFGGHTVERFLASDLIAISPGVPLDVPALVAAQQAGIPILGEIEIAGREFEAPLIAITGTNGKSTTTSVMGEIYRAWGEKVFVGGNLGTPLIDACAENGWQRIVAEVSSFQLEAIERFHPRHALLLNITEDHLDRYPDMASYVAAKLRVFERMTAADFAVINADDPWVVRVTSGIAPRRVPFSSSTVPAEGMGFDGRHLVWRWSGTEVSFNADELQLRGLHNIENVMAALIPPLLDGCPPAIAWQAACAFSGLPHRMQPVRTLNRVIWYNDSKGTNVGSVVKSLAGLTAPVTLIAGGKDKGGDYAPLAELVKAKVRHLILIGQAAPRIAAALGGLTHTVRATDMQEAVEQAWRLTEPGGVVLLSPGCSSFDMFSSYVERGEVFSAAVRALPEDRR